jgi:hypothetical protein
MTYTVKKASVLVVAFAMGIASMVKLLFFVFVGAYSFHAPFVSIRERQRAPHDAQTRNMMIKGFGFGINKHFKYTGKIKPGRRSPKRDVPPHIMRPDYSGVLVLLTWMCVCMYACMYVRLCVCRQACMCVCFASCPVVDLCLTEDGKPKVGAQRSLIVKTPEEIEGMKVAGRLARYAL